jgi:hypothetical protein
MSKWINSVKRLAFRPNSNAIKQFLKRAKPKLDIGVTSVMFFTHLAALLGFVVAVSSSCKRWIVFHTSALTWMITSIKPRPVMARLAN